MALSTEEQSLLRDTYLRLQDRPLDPDDPLYQPVYSLGEGEDPVAKLETHVEWAEVESLQLFSGFRGSGKTTELRRLRQHLEEQGFVVLYADALNYLNPAEEVDIATLLLAVAGSFGEQLSNAAGADVLGDGFWKRITHYLTSTSIEAKEAALEVGAETPAVALVGALNAGIDLKLALKTAPSFGQMLQDFLANRLGELKAQVDDFVGEGVKLVREHTREPNQPIVFIFDQFEQIRGSRTGEDAVLRSVERVFANHLPLLRLPYVHAIYTVPPWLQFVLPGAFGIETLPSVRLWNNDAERSRYAPGWDALRELVTKRFGRAGFAQFFGTTDGTESPLTDRLIQMSGGHFRDLLRLLREMLVLVRTWSRSLPVTETVVERAIVNVRDEYLPLATDDATWLREIAERRTTALPSASSENITRLSRFLDTHLVLYLTNGEDWYDVHPLIRDAVYATDAHLSEGG